MEATINTAMTVLPTEPIETEKTGKTNPISNQTFLCAIFGENLTDNQPILVSFAGNPANVDKKV